MLSKNNPINDKLFLLLIIFALAVIFASVLVIFKDVDTSIHHRVGLCANKNLSYTRHDGKMFCEGIMNGTYVEKEFVLYATKYYFVDG